MKNILTYIFVYGVVNILATLAFIALFHIPYFTGDFFYKGLFFVFVATLVAIVLMRLCQKKWTVIELKDVVMEGICFCCLTLSYFIVFPVTVERSISVHMLGYMDRHQDEAFSPLHFEQIFYNDYVVKNQAIPKRFHEQTSIGTLQREQGNTYRITPKGQRLVKLFRFIDWMFHTGTKNL